jgi:hypothetical protein
LKKLSQKDGVLNPFFDKSEEKLALGSWEQAASISLVLKLEVRMEV